MRFSWKKRGQAMVELALVIPLLIVLIFAIIDFGYYLFVMISVNHATRAAVRFASMNQTTNCNDIKNKVLQNAVGVVIATSNVTVTPVASDTSINGNPPTVTVAVNHTHKMFAPSLWQFSTLPIKSSYKGIVSTYEGVTTIQYTCP